MGFFQLNSREYFFFFGFLGRFRGNLRDVTHLTGSPKLGINHIIAFCVPLKDNKKTDKKKKTKKKGLVKKTKETASELKKVTWPSFGEVVKKTGIVIAFVVIFGLLIFGVDTLLGFLSSLLV